MAVARTAAAVALMVVAAATMMGGAEAGQNCICECVKLCMRTHIPGMEPCEGKCREEACVRSCEEACTRKGFPRLPAEGIPACEIEPLSPDEERMLH